MSFKFFTVPIHDAGDAERELNSFLRRHRVLSVERRWIEQGAEAFWHFCVSYRESGSDATTDTRQRHEPAARKPPVAKPQRLPVSGRMARTG